MCLLIAAASLTYLTVGQASAAPRWLALIGRDLVGARRACHQWCHVHRKGERNEPTASPPRCSRMPKKSPPTKVPAPPPVTGWRCDLCGEILTTKERPPCTRCHSDRITSMEVW